MLPVIFLTQRFFLHKNTCFLYDTCAKQFFDRGQNPAPTDTLRRHVSDGRTKNTFLGDLHVLHRTVLRPHPTTDVHSFQSRSCRAGTAQNPSVTCQNNLAVGSDVDKQYPARFLLQTAHTDSCHNIRPDIGGNRRQTVNDRLLPCRQPDLSGTHGLRFCKGRLIRRPSDGPCVHANQHMHHRTIRCHIDFPDLLPGNPRLFTKLFQFHI